MFIFLNIFSLFSVVFSSSDIMMNLAAEHGVQIESHYVTTDDGYILRLYHLPAKETSNTSEEKSESDEQHLRTMFFMHGLLCSSAMYITYPEHSAGYFFQKRGYDVWSGNARGNTYSRNHTKLNPDEQPFWKFSWHEIGYYDLPAMIDYVLNQTGQDQLIYVGHSQGVSSAFVMLSERPEYNEKIALLHAMTPPIILKQYSPYAPSSIKDINKMEDWVTRSNNFELFPRRDFIKPAQFLGELCTIAIFSSFCKYFNDILPGPTTKSSYYDHLLLDYTMSIPSGAGYRQFMHYGQLANSGRFQKFDYGPVENQKIYGSSTPPEYNYSNIRVKLHIMYGTHDYLVMQKNMPGLIKKLNHTIFAVTKFDLFNHLDFGYGRLVRNVQKSILKVTNQFMESINDDQDKE